MRRILDVHSRGEYPSCVLSNFAALPFYLDGIFCGSMEGFMQSLKFEKVHMQIDVCAASGLNAKARGTKRSKVWQRTQMLWWDGVPYDRHGPEYQGLLDRAFRALFDASAEFRQALLDTGDALLSHSIGSRDPYETILTEAEFCIRLMQLRDELKTV